MFSVTAILVSKPHPPILMTQRSENHKKQLVIQGFRHRSTVPKAMGELNLRTLSQGFVTPAYQLPLTDITLPSRGKPCLTPMLLIFQSKVP